MPVDIKIEGLTKRFNDVVAVNDLSLEVDEGEILALLGENGAGKSTLIKILCGLMHADDGKVFLMNKDAFACRNEIKPLIAVCPQETAVAVNLTVEENLKLIAGVYGLTKTQVEERTNVIMNDLGLAEVKCKRVKKLSGGMKRRLSIGMSLVTNPKILFLDEPTIGLDVRARRELWKIIENLKGKTTVVLTTHYLDEAETLADRIAIMEGGAIKAVGTLERLKSQTNKQTLEEVFLHLTQEVDA